MDKAPGHVKIIWILYLVNFVIPFTALIGVVLAYIWRGEDGAHPMASHFAKQIQVFWYALIGAVVGTVLLIVLIGWFVLIAVAIYFAVMSILGLVKALDDKPWG